MGIDLEIENYMGEKNKKQEYSRYQLFWLVTLRVLIGWYFLYEGVIKVLSPNWTSFGYLKDSKGIFAPLFSMLTENASIMNLVDTINMYGLVFIGLSLVLGAYVRTASIGGIALLSLYYLSHPPLLDVVYMMRPEGSYLWVDKNLIILCTLFIIILFPTSKQIGLDRIFIKKKNA